MKKIYMAPKQRVILLDTTGLLADSDSFRVIRVDNNAEISSPTVVYDAEVKGQRNSWDDEW